MGADKTEMPPERLELLDRRAFLHVAAGAATGAAVAGEIPEIAAAEKAAGSPRLSASKKRYRGGHLYMQTNETRNVVVHYRRAANGMLTELERVPTGGAGSGVLSPIYQISRPNDFEGAGSVILAPDQRFLFTTNAGDNSVSSFAVGEDGELTPVDIKRTGNAKNGGAKSLADAPSSMTLFVVHSFGPDHIRLISVSGDGKLTPRPEPSSVNTMDWPNRLPTMAVLSPDTKFLIVSTALDELPTRKNLDGSLVLWIPRSDGTLHFIAANAPDPDGLVMCPVSGDGTLGKPSFHDAGGASPFYIAFRWYASRRHLEINE